MRSGETILARHNSRSRVARDEGIEVLWGATSLAEFAGFAAMLVDAFGCSARCGELAKCRRGWVIRCAIVEVSLSHNSLTLWFSPEEFGSLVLAARRRLDDLAPPSTFGVPWTPEEGSLSFN